MTDEPTAAAVDTLDVDDDVANVAKILRQPGIMDMILGQPVPQILGLLVEAKKRIGAVRKEGKYDGGNSGSYNFRGVDQVTNAVAGVFIDLGILCTPEVIESTHNVYETTRQNGSVSRAFHHIMRMRYTFTAAVDGSTHSCVVEGESIDYSDKGTAQASSVAMRVALLQALTLPTDEPDPDEKRNEIISHRTEPQQGIARAPRQPDPPPVEYASKEDHVALTKWLKEQTPVVQTRTKTFIHSQAIPLARQQATADQLNAIEAYAREVADETKVDS